jgi:hypothetical protein
MDNPEHRGRGVVHAHAGVSETADGADDGDHRVGRRELKSEAHPVLQNPALRVARTAYPTPQS